MTSLAGYGIVVEPPTGWEARIFRLAGGEPTVHAATFPLPLHDGEFGVNATRSMSADAVFVALTEYRADNRLTPGKGLFAPARPRTLDAAQFSRNALLLNLPAQLGTQSFFSASGRAFSLYVVVGSSSAIGRRIAEVNGLLQGVRIAAQ